MCMMCVEMLMSHKMSLIEFAFNAKEEWNRDHHRSHFVCNKFFDAVAAAITNDTHSMCICARSQKSQRRTVNLFVVHEVKGRCSTLNLFSYHFRPTASRRRRACMCVGWGNLSISISNKVLDLNLDSTTRRRERAHCTWIPWRCLAMRAAHTKTDWNKTTTKINKKNENTHCDAIVKRYFIAFQPADFVSVCRSAWVFLHFNVVRAARTNNICCHSTTPTVHSFIAFIRCKIPYTY